MSKNKFPIKVKRGHTVVKIYLTPSHGSPSYTVVSYLGTQRQRKTFAELDRALIEAETIATKLSAGELDVLTLTSDDRLSYVRAVESLRPTGVSLEVAAARFAEAWGVLDGRCLVEAARYFAKHHPHGRERKHVPAVVAELVAAKEGDGMSAVYVKDLRGRLRRFAERFPGPLIEVTSGDIDDFLRGLRSVEQDGAAGAVLSGKSRNNYRRAIGTLFHFAESRGYLPKGLDQVGGVALAKEEEGDIEIFRPGELARVLELAAPALVPFLAIAAFAGLRHAEIQRLDWAEVELESGYIEIKAGKAKTASRRLVPIAENLRRWLAPLRQPSGPVCEYANMSKQLVWLAEAVLAAMQADTPPAAFAWKHNALRHSYISYRVALVQDVARVALEAGNSPRMVFSNYRELVRPADAGQWFGITPESVAAAKAARETAGQPANIVALPVAAAA